MAAADESIDLNSTIGSNADNDASSSEIDGEDNKESDKGVVISGINMMEFVSRDTKEKLVDGMLELYEPDLTAVHERVKEVVRNQGVLLDSTQNELTQLKECSMLNDITETFENVKIYHKKILTIKKDMNQLLERANKVKLRARKLQLQKEKDELAIALEKERQLKYEKELAAKPAVEYLPNT